MSGPAAPPAPAGRPNPFAFPSNVDFAFVLLVAVIVGTSLVIHLGVGNALAAGLAPQSELNARCQAAAGPLNPDDTLQQRERWLDAFNACQNAVTRPVAWIAFGMTALLVAAAAFYLLHPAWKMRRQRLVPLTADDAPEVLAELHRLSQVAAVAPPPAFVWNPLNMACSGLAFGLPGQRRVAITGGLATRLWTDPDVFRAVVLHELAHLRNRDVDKAYVTMAIWWSFLVTTLVPFTLIVSAEPSAAARRILSLLALAAVVYLLRDAALRARETYADVRASTWPHFAAGLDRALPPSPALARGWRARLHGAIAWFSRHPSVGERRDAVRDTAPLFAAGPWFAVGTGLAGSLALHGAGTVTDLAVPGSGVVLSAVVFAILIAAVAGLGLWRSVFLAEARAKRPRGVWLVGAGLAAGVATGDVLSLSATAAVPDGFALSGLSLLFFDLVWFGLLLAGVGCFCRWTVACASVWLPTVATRASPRLALFAGAVPGAFLLAVCLNFLVSASEFRVSGGILPFSLALKSLAAQGLPSFPDGPYTEAVFLLVFLVLQVVSSPVVYAAVQLIWLTPLAAWLFRRRAAPPAAARWGWLDPLRAPVFQAAPPPLRPVLSAAVGGGAGLLFGLFALLVTALLVALAPDATAGWLVIGEPILGVLLQVAVAAALAMGVRRLGAVHGLFGAFACGCVTVAMTMLAVLLALGLKGVRTEGLTIAVVTTYLNLAALLVLPAAVAGAGLASWIRGPGRAVPAPYPVR